MTQVAVETTPRKRTPPKVDKKAAVEKLAKVDKKMPLDIKAMKKLFDCSHQTLYNWRHREQDPMPTHLEGTRVYFKLPAVKTWAKRNKIEVVAKELARLEK